MVLHLSVVEPFTSPTWGSNFTVFSSSTGVPIPEEETKSYLARAFKYAKKFIVYLVPERFIMLGNQSMCLIGPNGSVVGAQQGIFENPAFLSAKKSTQIDVWDTVFGGVFLAVDTDIYHPEVAKIAFNLGANIIVSSQHLTAAQYSTHRVVSGSWNIAQSNNLFVVSACNQFNCVSAPKELTKYKDGFYVSPTSRLPVTAKLSMKQLKKLPLKPRLSRQFYAYHKEDLLGVHNCKEKEVTA